PLSVAPSFPTRRSSDLVDAEGLDGPGRVDERLALADAGAGGGEVDDVGAEAAGGQAEAGARPRGRLEEEVDDHLALEVVALAARSEEHTSELQSPDHLV